MRSRKIVGVVCLITALAIVAGCQQTQSTDPNANFDQSIAANATPAEPLKMDVDQLPAKQPPAKAPVVKKPASKTAPTKAAASTRPVTTSATSGAVAVDRTPASMPMVESRPVAVKRQGEDTIVTVISGCLEGDDGMFRLKDTDGEHAPKSRSWKSGFIRKGSAKVDVIDTSNHLKLATHVGYRVSVSGTLVDREIHARSLRASSDRCD